jgi:hypothetical protein
MVSGLYLLHQTLAALIQNICRCEYGRPGKRPSAPFLTTQELYARYASLIPPLSAMFSPWVLMPLIWNVNAMH